MCLYLPSGACTDNITESEFAAKHMNYIHLIDEHNMLSGFHLQWHSTMAVAAIEADEAIASSVFSSFFFFFFFFLIF